MSRYFTAPSRPEACFETLHTVVSAACSTMERPSSEKDSAPFHLALSWSLPSLVTSVSLALPLRPRAEVLRTGQAGVSSLRGLPTLPYGNFNLPSSGDKVCTPAQPTIWAVISTYLSSRTSGRCDDGYGIAVARRGTAPPRDRTNHHESFS